MDATVKCKLCNFKIRIKREFQSSYIKHVRESHKELTEQDLELMEIEIRKLRTKDVCPELPAFLKGPKALTSCEICGINLFKTTLLKKHIENVHGTTGNELRN